MIEFLYAAYGATLPWIVGALSALSVYKRNWTLFRCVAIIAFGQVAIDAWFHYLAPVKFAGQPYGLSLLIYAASATAASIRPSGKLCSTLGGVFIAGAAFSVIALAFKYSPARDYMFWEANVLLGVLQLAVVMGGATGERGRRFCVALGRRASRMAYGSRSGGVA
jgi:hypothetical protein